MLFLPYDFFDVSVQGFEKSMLPFKGHPNETFLAGKLRRLTFGQKDSLHLHREKDHPASLLKCLLALPCSNIRYQAEAPTDRGWMDLYD